MSEEKLQEIKEELAKISFSNIGHCVNTNLILDCITNLQEENNRLNNIIKEIEKERCNLRNSNELLENAIHTLQDRNKEIYEGFMATTEELCEATKEIERLHSIIKEVREYIENNNLYEQDYTYDYEENIEEWPPDDTNVRKELLEILDKVDKGE